MSDDARRVTLGRISGVYGIKGWVKVYSYSRPLEGILKYPVWMIGEPVQALKLLDGRAHAGGVVAQLANAAGAAIEDRDQAARLVGQDIAVHRSDLPKPRPGEVYWVDLVGLSVENSDGVPLGVVTEVTSNGAQDVLVVSGNDASGEAVQRMIPMVRGPIITSVSLEARKIVANWQPEW